MWKHFVAAFIVGYVWFAFITFISGWTLPIILLCVVFGGVVLSIVSTLLYCTILDGIEGNGGE